MVAATALGRVAAVVFIDVTIGIADDGIVGVEVAGSICGLDRSSGGMGGMANNSSSSGSGEQARRRTRKRKAARGRPRCIVGDGNVR